MTITEQLQPLAGRILQDIQCTGRLSVVNAACCLGRQVTGVRYVRGMGILLLLEPPTLWDEPPALLLPTRRIRWVGVYQNYVRLLLSHRGRMKILTSDPANRELYYPTQEGTHD